MYRCQMCGASSFPNAAVIRRVVETREVEYPQREYKVNGRPVLDPGGVGTEISKSVPVCPACAYALDVGTPFKQWVPRPTASPQKRRRARKPRPEPEPETLPEITTIQLEPSFS